MFDDMHYAVLEFIRESGTTATLLKAPTGDYDPATGSVPDSDVEIPVELILMDLTLQSNGLSVKYNTLVEAGDKEAYVKPNRTTPFDIKQDDRIQVAGKVYKVMTVKELDPTGTEVILFTLYLRR